MKKRRWTCIDILKCLAAIAVVEIHKPLEIQGGDEFLILCRFAVPVFFMITGFFYPETVAKKRELKQFGKIFTITIGANLFYLLWEILLAVEKRENIKEALLARFEKRVPEDFILWNFSPLSPHLWYLQALLYVLVIAFIVEHLGLRKLAYLAIPVLLAGSLIKGSYSLFLWEKKTVIFIMQGTFCTADFPFSGWAAGLDPERRLFLAFWTGRKWDFCCVDFLFSGIWLLWSRSGWKSEMSWEPRKSMLEPFFWQSASFFFLLAGRIFMWRILLPEHWQKWEKTIPCLSMFFTMRFCRPCPDALKAEGACSQRDTISMG